MLLFVFELWKWTKKLINLLFGRGRNVVFPESVEARGRIFFQKSRRQLCHFALHEKIDLGPDLTT